MRAVPVQLSDSIRECRGINEVPMRDRQGIEEPERPRKVGPA
jgi:hypothetical protein